MVRLKRYDVLLQELERRLNGMKGEDRQYLLSHIDMLKELDDVSFRGVMDLYNDLLKINGMSEVTAWSTTIQISRKAAQV